MIQTTGRGTGQGSVGGDHTVVRLVPNGTRAQPEGAADNDADQARQVAGTLRHHLNVQYNLCGALEALADDLPVDARNDDCVALARSVYPIIHRSHVFEEDVLFPFLTMHCGDREDLATILNRLHGEHWEDEAFAEEVHHELLAFAADRSSVSAEKLGYMLRGFFVGLRRHLAFEREHILPLVDMQGTM